MSGFPSWEKLIGNPSLDVMLPRVGQLSEHGTEKGRLKGGGIWDVKEVVILGVL